MAARKEMQMKIDLEDDRQHANTLSQLRGELEAELLTLKRTLDNKADAFRKEALELVSCSREELQNRLRDGRVKHVEEMKALQRDHDNEVQMI